jgi:hypothetical protein
MITVVGAQDFAERRLVTELTRRGKPTRARAAKAQWAFGSPEDCVVALGRLFSPAPTMEVTTGSGFAGAAEYVRQHRGAVYVEGFVLATDDEQVVAASWAARGDQVMYGPAAEVYLGVPIAESFRLAVRRRSGAAAVIHGQQLDRWRLLRAGLPPDAIVEHAGRLRHS